MRRDEALAFAAKECSPRGKAFEWRDMGWLMLVGSIKL